MPFVAILLMGGEGTRFRDPLPKQFHLIGQKKVYLHTLENILETNFFKEVILVCSSKWMDIVRQETESFPCSVVLGGNSRQSSSFEGLKACPPNTQFVMIHDAVRPFVSKDVIERNVEAVVKYQAVDTCIFSTDTVVELDSPYLNPLKIASIPERIRHMRGQTPQTFNFNLIRLAHLTTQKKNATDDCSLVLEMNHPVIAVQGDEINIKITTSLDLTLAKILYDQKLVHTPL